MSSTTTARLDKAAIGISALCLVHCLVLPVALALIPSVALLSTLNDEMFHLALVALVLPTSLVALTLGCKRHRNWGVLTLGVAGILVLLVTAILGHDYLTEFQEKAFTVLGAILVAASHVQNFRLCRKTDCED